MDYQEILQSILHLPEDKIAMILPHVRFQEYKSGTHFLRAGEETHHLGIIFQGVFRFYYISYEGKDVTKSFCSEGEFVGTYSALIQNIPAEYSIEALEAGSVLTFPFAEFLRLSERDSTWRSLHLHLVEQLYLKKQQREQELLLYDAQSRYLHFLASYPQLKNRVKQYHIASYLGITPVALSRIRTHLRTTSDN